MVRRAVKDEAFIDQFSVFEDDGYTKRSGLTVGDFTVTIWYEGTVLPISFSIAEIGTSGEYTIGFIPSGTGFWKSEIHIDFNDEILSTDIEVLEADLDSINVSLEEIKDGGTGAFVPTEDSLHNLKIDLTRILGLLHHNAILDDQVYDSNLQLTSARLRVFDTAAHVPVTPGGSETLGLLHEYTIEGEWSGLATAIRYTLKRVI